MLNTSKFDWQNKQIIGRGKSGKQNNSTNNNINSMDLNRYILCIEDLSWPNHIRSVRFVNIYIYVVIVFGFIYDAINTHVYIVRSRYRNMMALYLALVELSGDFDRNERYRFRWCDECLPKTCVIWSEGKGENGKGLFRLVIKDCTEIRIVAFLSCSLSLSYTHKVMFCYRALWPNIERVNARVHLLSAGSFHSICTRLVAKRFMQFW